MTVCLCEFVVISASLLPSSVDLIIEIDSNNERIELLKSNYNIIPSANEHNL